MEWRSSSGRSDQLSGPYEEAIDEEEMKVVRAMAMVARKLSEAG